MYGAQLIEALRRTLSVRQVASDGNSKSPPSREERGKGGALQLDFSSLSIEFFGVGGERMRAVGCEIVVDAKELAVVGITEILGHLPKIWRLFHLLIAEGGRRKPDLAIVIDSPAFNWRVAREMKKRGVPVVYYVCPQFWAWRQWRVRLLRKYVDKALAIFPFEEKFYRDRGVDAEFVGHPLADLARPGISREEYAGENGLDPAKHWITLMPGSRRKEVRMNLPEMLGAARLLGDKYEFLLPVAPTLKWDFVRGLVNPGLSTRVDAANTGERNSPARVGAPGPTQGSPIHLVRDSLPALAHSRAGIVASGTATVEAALMETPFVMVYRVTPLTYLLGRWTVKVPHFAMTNLIAGRELVPELVQRDFTAERVAAEINRVVVDGDARDAMLSGLREVRSLLRGNLAGDHPVEKAARAVLDLLPQTQFST
jgi:lipid-A-disaccharide synthase